MSRRSWIAAGFIVALAILTCKAHAAPMQTDLAVYVARVRALYPEVEVTGRFHDWRSVSIYRSHAGLHLGYDIAMHAGRQVPAGWPGVVTAITPWTGTEYGITVQLAGGYNVTYGHLKPLVHEGQAISAGTFVGVIMHDHVDMKVRTSSGGYFDWGESYGVLDGSSPWVAGNGGGLLPPPPGSEAPVTVTGGGVDALEASYRQQVQVATVRKAERDSVANALSSLSTYIDHESAGLPEAESQMLAWYRAADDHKVSPEQVEALSLTVKARREKVNRLSYVMMAHQRTLAEKDAAYKAAVAQADATRAAAREAGASERTLKNIESDALEAAEKVTGNVAHNSDLERRVAEAEQRYKYLSERYTIGGASRTDVDEAARTAERLRVALALWQQGDQSSARDLTW